jgi:hypothetical protein
MAIIPTQRLLKPEDFDSKDQALVSKLAFPINTFMQQVISALTNNLDFNNLNMQVNTFSVIVDPNGVPTTPVQFTINLSTKLYGLICINATNTSGTTRVPTAQPFINYSLNAGKVTVNNITGLSYPSTVSTSTAQVNSDSYTLTVLSIGQNVPST